MTDEEYITQRLQKQQKYHSNKSSVYKKRFVILNLVIMGLSAAIPVVTCLIDLFPLVSKIIIAAFGGASTVLTGYLSISNINSLFIEYRMTSEKLKSLEYMYKTKTPPFDNDSAFEKLVNECEDAIYKGNDKWYTTLKTKQEKREQASQTGS